MKRVKILGVFIIIITVIILNSCISTYVVYEPLNETNKVNPGKIAVISGYDNELYNSLLTEERGWIRRYLLTSTRDTTGKDYPRTEVLWGNEYYAKAINDNTLPIELSPQEIKANKINPPR